MRGRVCALIELGAGFNPILSGRENIYNSAALLGIPKNVVDRKLDAIIAFAELEKFIDMPLQNYSSGMKVRLGFSVAMQMEPDILLLDEVLAVGDVGFRFKCLNAIGKLIQNSAVIFVSHSIPQIYRICTSALLLERGEIVYSGNSIKDAIDRYYSKMDSSVNEITSNDHIQLESISISANGETYEAPTKLVLEYGASPTVKIKYRNISQKAPLKVQIVIWNQDMHPVLELLSQDKEFITTDSVPGDDITLEIPIDKTKLNGGRYSIEVVFHTLNLDRRIARYCPDISIQVPTFCVSGANTIHLTDFKVTKNQPSS